MHGGLRQGSHGDEALGMRGLWHCLLLASPSRRAPPRPLQPAGPCAPDGDAGDAAQGLPRRLPQRTRQSRPGSASADACCAAGRSGPFYMMDGCADGRAGGRGVNPLCIPAECGFRAFRGSNEEVWKPLQQQGCSLGSRAGWITLPVGLLWVKSSQCTVLMSVVGFAGFCKERCLEIHFESEEGRVRERWHGARLHWPAPSPFWCSRVEWLRRFTFRHDWAHCRHFARRSVSKVALCRPPTPQLARWLLPK